MLTTLNNFTKYNFTIRTPIQIIYDFRIRETLNLLRIENLDLIVTKVRIVIIIIYLIIIKKAIKNDFLIRRKLSSFKVIILAMSSISRQIITFIKATFFIKEPTLYQIITFIKVISFIKKSISR